MSDFSLFRSSVDVKIGHSILDVIIGGSTCQTFIKICHRQITTLLGLRSYQLSEECGLMITDPLHSGCPDIE